MRLTTCLLAVTAIACLAGSLTMPVLRYANRDFARHDIFIATGEAPALPLLAVPVFFMAAVVIVAALSGAHTREAGAFGLAAGAFQLLGVGETIRVRRDHVIMWDGIAPNGEPIGGTEQPELWWGLAFAAAAGFALVAAGIVQIEEHRYRAPEQRHGP
ncbi:hypothetical protein [Brevibacterium luteolum]|uniref:hypothetical protein n=1 Tax=Brevibacterium luteolum TaxID=199591 RepID=UPI001C242B43|nr:hypothetical protein [Brevibacterium luteolum]MBU8578587.1 hypothetical protein [Brevibacterium luteolum]